MTRPRHLTAALHIGGVGITVARDAMRGVWRHVPRRVRILAGCVVVVAILLHSNIHQTGDPAPHIAGLPQATHPITIYKMTASEFVERLRQIRSASVTLDVRCQRLALHALGLVQQIEPQLDLTTTALSTALAGPTLVDAYYAAGTDTIYAVDPSAATVAHEWIHAIDDQYGRRMREAARATTTDARMALRAAIEGTAVRTLNSPPLVVPLSTDLDANSWVLAYGLGPHYIERETGGDMTRALTLAPHTSYEILFDQRLPRLQLDSAVVQATDRRLCSDQVGALGVLTALRTAAIPGTAAWTIARAWRGDRLDVVITPANQRIVVWTVAFADTLAATAWQRWTRPLTGLHLDQSIDLRVIVGGQPHLSTFDHLTQ